ncbi:MAG: CRISPR-associated protein Cas6 [Thermodesulfobacteriota bacterium]|nr:MAG: CRISPR-associated protein Cas6 [Thermodesulfobacteriota bacterium]
MSFLKIPYKILRLTCEPEDELYLPLFKGSSFRGVLGRTLKNALCVLKTYQECRQCPIYLKCYYAYIFETIPDPKKIAPFNLHKYPSIPHPFVIEPPEEKKTLYKKGETFSLKIILIGKAVAYEPHFILAMRLAGEHGIGKGNRRFVITDYFSTGILNQSITFDLSTQKSNNNKLSKITFEFVTPLRLVYQKKLVKILEFHHIIRALLRRISILYYFHVSEDMPPIPAKELINLSENIKTLQYDLKWFDWERYSYRQNRRMILGGLVGQIVFEGNLSPFHDLIKAGEIFHCGKNTSFGLGKYKFLIF